MSRMTIKLIGEEHLLAIWHGAKGKERDAMLWGDEVHQYCGFAGYWLIFF
jgi:hypothetical protein